MKFSEIKSTARESLKDNWGIAILAAFIASTFGALGGSTSSFTVKEEVDFSKLSALTLEEILAVLAVFGGIIIFGLVASVIISSFIAIGYAQFNLDLVDGCSPKISVMFSKGNQIFTSICANVLVFIRVFFGFLLFVIPGIVASYRYALVNYVIADNPGISAREALKMCKEMMKGKKLRLFFFGLSFFGWALLVVLTLGIAAIWVIPYMQASFAAFYRDVE